MPSLKLRMYNGVVEAIILPRNFINRSSYKILIEQTVLACELAHQRVKSVPDIANREKFYRRYCCHFTMIFLINTTICIDDIKA